LWALAVVGASLAAMMFVPGIFASYTIYVMYLLIMIYGVAHGIIGL